jgi:hypothetical protein
MSAGDALLERIGTLLVEQDADPRLPWHNDPVGFARDCIEWPDGEELAAYQDEILAALPAGLRAALRSLHGAGKTTTVALVVLWFALTRDAAGVDWKCITTAGGWRQLERYLWPEIHKWAKRIRWDKVGRLPFDRHELTAHTMKLDHGQAFAAASDDPALLEGAHAESLLIIADEGKSISAAVFDAIEGAMSGTGEAFALVTSTPGPPIGRFYEICVHRPGLEDWRTFHVGLEDAIAAGRVSRKWAEQRALQWGADSAVYANRVLGEFAASDEDGVIPLTWVEAAVERWQAWRDLGSVTAIGRPVIGVDVGRGGDKSVIAFLRGSVVEFVERHSAPDTMAITGHVLKYAREPGSLSVVDVIGIGSGPVDRLREQHVGVDAFNASHRSDRKDRAGALGFLNRRAESWWHLRELLDPTFGAILALPDDDELIGDLTSPRWTPNSTGKIQIEGKDEIRKRLGRSPDAGDAVVMACTAFSGYGGYGSANPGQSTFVQWASVEEGRRNGWDWDTSLPPSEWARTQNTGFDFIMASGR